MLKAKEQNRGNKKVSQCICVYVILDMAAMEEEMMERAMGRSIGTAF